MNYYDYNRDKIVAALTLVHGRKCFYCKKRLTSQTFQIDHLVPILLGGTNHTDNLRPVCERCNTYKSNHTFEIWSQRIMNSLEKQMVEVRRLRRILKTLNEEGLL